MRDGRLRRDVRHRRRPGHRVSRESTELVDQLHARGLTQLLTEGGPSLLGSLTAAGLVDELCYTIAPHLVGGEHPRTVGADGVPATLELALLVEQDSTIMGRWFVR